MKGFYQPITVSLDPRMLTILDHMVVLEIIPNRSHLIRSIIWEFFFRHEELVKAIINLQCTIHQSVELKDDDMRTKKGQAKVLRDLKKALETKGEEP